MGLLWLLLKGPFWASRWDPVCKKALGLLPYEPINCSTQSGSYTVVC